MFGDMEETSVNLRENPESCNTLPISRCIDATHFRNADRRPACARQGPIRRAVGGEPIFRFPAASYRPVIYEPAARACAANPPKRSCATGSAYLSRISVSIHAQVARAQSVSAWRVACPSMS